MKLRFYSIFWSLVVFISTVFTALVLDSSASTPCYEWSNQEPLQQVVDSNTCVNIVNGTYNMTSEVIVRTGGTVTINGNGAVFKAVRSVRKVMPRSPRIITTSTTNLESWVQAPDWANKALFRAANNTRLIMSNATLDGSNLVSYLVTAKNDSSRYSIDRLNLKNGACSAVGIFSNGITITNSHMEHNGFNCQIFSGVREAAAIYSEKQEGGYHFSPVVTGNTIIDSYGPALDINGVWGGTFSNNKVSNNTEWAAVSLFGASYWKITNNIITHSPTTSVQNYHPLCQPSSGPIGNRSAAIFLCQDSGVAPYLTNFNVIEGNQASGGYGILLVGADETQPWMTPRLNTIKNNSVFGSLYGCADDLKSGQWLDGNTWTGNNCLGTPNTAPATF